MLCSVDYLLDGNQLTTTTNGVQGAPQAVSTTNLVLTGDTGLNRVTVRNFAGHVTFNGLGGGDIIGVTAGGGGRVTIADAVPAGAKAQVTVRAPTSIQADVTVGLTQVNVGSDVIEYDTNVAALSLVGQLFSNGDNLTVNAGSGTEAISLGTSSINIGSGPTIFYSTFASLSINGGGGDDSFSIQGDSIPTTVTAGAGNAQFTVNSNAVTLALVGGAGNSTYTVNGNSGALSISGGIGNGTFVVNGSASQLTLNSGTGTNAYNVTGNSAALTINANGAVNNVTVNSNSGGLTVNGQAGNDSYTVVSTTGGVTLRGGTGNTQYLISAPTITGVNVVGNAAGVGTLTFRGTVLTDAFTVTAGTLFAGTGALVSYSNLRNVRVEGIDGADTFVMTSSSTPTTLVSGTGNSVFNLRANTALTTVDATASISTINLGNLAPTASGNLLSTLAGGVSVLANGDDTLNLDDTGRSVATTIGISTTALTGIGAGTFTYSGLATINLTLGSGGTTANITGSPAATALNVNLGTGSNTVNLGSAGNLDALSATLNLTNATRMVVTDTTAVAIKTGTLAPTRLTGLLPGTVNFTGATTFGLTLGTGGTALLVSDTLSTTVTTITSGAATDRIRLQNLAGDTRINVGANDEVLVIGSNAPLTVTSTGNALLTLGNAALPTAGVMNGINGSVSFVGGGTDRIVANDTGNTAGATGALTGTTLTGLSGGALTYSGVANLEIRLGTGDDTMRVNSTAANTNTLINDLSGRNYIGVATTSGDMAINLGGTGRSVVLLGVIYGVPALMSGIASHVAVTGNGETVLVADDSAASVPRNWTLSATQLIGVAGQVTDYAGLGSLSLSFGGGADTVRALSTSVPTVVTVGGGANNVRVSSAASGPAGTLAGITGNLVLSGLGALTVDATDEATDMNVALSENAIVGAAPATITHSGFTQLTLRLGSGADTVRVDGTHTGSTSVLTGPGSDTVQVAGSTGPLTINGSVGTNTFTLGDNAGSLAAVLGPVTFIGSGADALTVNGGGNTAPTTSTLTGTTIAGLTPGSLVSYSGLATLDVTLGQGADLFTIVSTGAVTHLAAGDGADTLYVVGNSNDLTLETGAGENRLTVGGDASPAARKLDALLAALVVDGSNGALAVRIDDSGSTAGRSLTLDGTTLTSPGLGVLTYTNAASLGIYGGAFADTFTVSNTAQGTVTGINTGGGADTLTVLANRSGLSLIDGGGADMVNITMSPDLLGDVAVVGAGSALNVLGTGMAGQVVALTPNTITGMAPGRLSFAGVSNLSIDLSDGDDQLTITGTSAAATIVRGNGGDDRFVIIGNTGSLAVDGNSGFNSFDVGVTAGTITGVHELAITGNGSDVLVVDDSARSDALASGSRVIADVSRFQLATADITFTGLGSATYRLAQTGDALVIRDTAAATTSSFELGANADIVEVRNLSGPTTLTTGGGDDSVNVFATNAALTILNASGKDTVTLGGTDHLTAPIAGAVVLSGSGLDDLFFNDSGNTGAVSATLTAATVAGLTTVPVAFTGYARLDITLGSGGDSLDVTGTIAGTTALDTGAGADTVVVRATAGVLSLAMGAGDDVVTLHGNSASLSVNTGADDDRVAVLATGAATSINADGGTNVIRVGSSDTSADLTAKGGTLAAINGALTIVGGGGTTMLLDGSAATTGSTLGITFDTVTGAAPASIVYGGLSALKLFLGAGDDRISVNSTSVDTRVETGTGTDSVTLAVSGAVLPFGGPLTLVASGSNAAFTLQDTVTATHALNLSATTLDGLGGRVIYTGFATRGITSDNASDITVTGVVPGVTSTFQIGAPISFEGDFIGDLSLTGGIGLVMTVSGDFLGNLNVAGPLSMLTVGGNYVGTSTLAGGINQFRVGGDLTGSLTTGGAITTASVGRDLAGSLSVGGSLESLTIGGNLSGIVTTGGTLGAMTLNGDLSGNVTVPGSGDTLDITGNLLGTLSYSGGLRTANIGKDLSGNLLVGGAVDAFAIGGVFSGNAAIAGATGVVSVTGPIAGTLTLGNSLNSLTVRDDLSGNVTVAGPAGAIMLSKLSGQLTLMGVTSDLQVEGDLAGRAELQSAANNILVGGNLAGTVTATGKVTTLGVGGTLNGLAALTGGAGSAHVVGNLAGRIVSSADVSEVKIDGDLTGLSSVNGGVGAATVGGTLGGTFTATGSVTALRIGRDLSGSVTVGGTLESLAVAKDLSGSVIVGGKLGAVTIGGSAMGSLTAGSLSTVRVDSATPANADGKLLEMTEGGVRRLIRARGTNASPTGVTFTLLYTGTDGDSAARPSASITIAGTASERYDLSLSTVPTAAFDLTSLSSNGVAGVRNVTVGGSIMGGAINLPGDSLAVVSARDVMMASAIKASSIQGVAFAFLNGPGGIVRTAHGVANNDYGRDILNKALVMDPATKGRKPFATIASPTDVAIVAVGETNPVGLFVSGKTGGKRFKKLRAQEVELFDNALDGKSLTAKVTFSDKAVGAHWIVNNVSFDAPGGSLDTATIVNQITSTEVVGDIVLRGGKKEKLSIFAPGMTGELTISRGGKLITPLPIVAEV